MFQPLAVCIGARYTRAKRRNHFISFISLTSMLGMALGITALITVLSVMNGFQQELRERILGVTAHASIVGWQGRLRDWPALLDAVQQAARIEGASPYIRSEAMLSHAGQVSGIVLQGILPEREAETTALAERMRQGRLQALEPGTFGIVIGAALARSLALNEGDALTVISPQPGVGPLGVSPRLRRFTVVGIFDAGMYEYDRGLALVHLEDAAALFRMGESISGIRLRLDDIFAAPRIAQALEGQLQQDLPGAYSLSDWSREHGNFFRAVQIEKTAMFIIMTLIVAVAAFNIVSTLVMVVTDKQSDIAILRTLGMSPLAVMGIFLVQGCIIGLVGTALGVVGGVALASHIDVVVPLIEQGLGFKFLAPDVYLISDLPSRVLWNDVVNIASVSLLLSLVATLYPAWQAARLHPVEALRHE